MTTSPIRVQYTVAVPDERNVDTIPEAVTALDLAMSRLQEAVTEVADNRARFIAHLATTTSVREAAEALGISPAAVSKAVARAETSHVDDDPAGIPADPTGRVPGTKRIGEYIR